MLTVLPLGGNNITRDLTAELISFAQAEEIKFIRGYKSTANYNDGVNNETVDKVIYARMGEILSNVRYQIEESGEMVHHIVFTGGGSKLKNIKELLDEFMPNFSTEIKPEPQFNLISESSVNVYETITTALYGLLKQGKANCCEETMTAAEKAAQENGVLFFPEEPTTQEEKLNSEEELKKAKEEEERRKREEAAEKERKEKERQEKNKKPQGQKRNSILGPLFDFAKTFVTNATSEDENDNQDTTTK